MNAREEALWTLAGTNRLGSAFFREASRLLVAYSGCRFAAVARLRSTEERVDLLGCFDREADAEPFSFDLEGTPCSEVYATASRRVLFPDAIQERFPELELLASLDARSYRAARFSDPAGAPLGHVLMIDDRPAAEDDSEDGAEIDQLLALVARRVESEYSRWSRERTLESYRQMVAASQDQLAFVDGNRRYRAVNPSYVESTRWRLQDPTLEAESLIGRRVEDVLGAEFFESSVRHNLDRSLGGHSVTVQGWYEVPGLPRRCLNADYHPCFDEVTGEVLGVVATIRDVTRTKRDQEVVTELATHESLIGGDLEASSRLITEVVASALEVERASVWLLEDGERLRCLDLYQASSGRHRAGGVLEAGDVGEYFDSVVEGREIDAHDAHRDPRTRCLYKSGWIPQEVTSILDVPIWVRGEVRGVLCHGHVGAPRIWQATELAFVGEVAGLMTQAIMAHERRGLESRLFEAQKLESLGVLAGGIAHDFNNLLVGMLGGAELALGQLSPDSLARRHLETLQRSALRASELCSQMLAYAGKGRFLTRVVDLSRVVSETADLLRASLDKDGMLHLDLPTELPAIEVDVTQVRQVVMNLLTNASDVLGGRPGRVSLTTELRHLAPGDVAAFHGAELRPGAFVVLRVEDTGCGMDATTRRRIFEPFFTTKDTGRGLGMAAVLGIMRSHGGGIRIESRVGEGTRIEIAFPMVAKPATTEESDPERPTGASRAGLVLVVDDEEIVRLVASGVLEGGGYRVLLAEDGLEGVTLFRRHADELTAVIPDLTMPVLGGDEALAQMQAIAPQVPVILASGYSTEDAAGRFEGRGIAEFLHKPFRARQLLEAVHRATADVAVIAGDGPRSLQ